MENFNKQKKTTQICQSHTKCLRYIPNLFPVANLKVRCFVTFAHNFIVINLALPRIN